MLFVCSLIMGMSLYAQSEYEEEVEAYEEISGESANATDTANACAHVGLGGKETSGDKAQLDAELEDLEYFEEEMEMMREEEEYYYEDEGSPEGEAGAGEGEGEGTLTDEEASKEESLK